MRDPSNDPRHGDVWRKRGGTLLRSVEDVVEAFKPLDPDRHDPRARYAWRQVIFDKEEGGREDWPISLFEKVSRSSWELVAAAQ